MKKILFLMFLSFSSILFAKSTLNDFINDQIKIEAQLLDYNLSLEKKVALKESQVTQYQEFFFHYASEKDLHLQEPNPYRLQVNRLKLRLRSNKQKGYINASKRDEVLLKNFTLRQGIRDALNEVLALSSSETKKFFKDKISDIIVKYFSGYTPLEEKHYVLKEGEKSSKITEKTRLALDELAYLKNVTHTLSAEALENTSLIYTTARFSNSRVFSFINIINNSEYGQKANAILKPLHIDIAKMILLISLILIILVVRFVISFTIRQTLLHYKMTEEGRAYIQSRIGRVFNYISSLMVLHLLVLAYIGFETSAATITKVFAVLYVILITILFYRITNTVAYMKMESMKKSKALKNEVVNLSLKVINAMLIFIAIIVILKIMGVDLTAILSGLGIAGAAIAFAAKDSISNIFGSISILLGDVFEQGEWIETPDVNGTVVEIGLRATTIRTFDNALISIPNSHLADHGVKNWSRRNIGRRIKMHIGVTYQAKISDIKQAIEEIREMLKEHPGIANERTAFQNAYRQAKLVSVEDYKGVKRTTLVYLDSYGDSSINILVYCFSRTVDWAEWLKVKEDVMYQLAEILEKNNLEFAYPTMTIVKAEEEKEEKDPKRY